MNRDIIETALIDQNLTSYEKFFDPEWCKRALAKAEGSPLEDALNALVMAWRTTNGAHVLPGLMVRSLEGFDQGKVNGNLRYRASYSDEVVNGIVTRLVEQMHCRLTLDQRFALKRAVARIEKDAHQAIRQARDRVRIDAPAYWQFLIENWEFRFCVLGVQRINYGSLFFAYEDFLANVIRTREPAYSSKQKKISDALAHHFGQPLADHCWNHVEVDLARLVRNALAHNGGRYGKDQEKHAGRFSDATGVPNPPLEGGRFVVVDGKIQITPDNTTYLFGVLKERVTRIVEAPT